MCSVGGEGRRFLRNGRSSERKAIRRECWGSSLDAEAEGKDDERRMALVVRTSGYIGERR